VLRLNLHKLYMMAVAAGARMIEKHVKIGDLDWVHFDGVAIDGGLFDGIQLQYIQYPDDPKVRPNSGIEEDSLRMAQIFPST
jgi:hypothetical protein